MTLIAGFFVSNGLLPSLSKVVFVKGGEVDERAPSSCIGEVGQNVTLPCHDLAANLTPALTQWLKDGSIVVKRNHTSERTSTSNHFTILDNGSLVITGLMRIDDGSYECQCTLRNTSKVHSHTVVKLQVVSKFTYIL